MWRIIDCHTSMYLIEAKERILIIDAGMAREDLRSVVDDLTDKPVALAIPHGHIDHAMAMDQFDSVFIKAEAAHSS